MVTSFESLTLTRWLRTMSCVDPEGLALSSALQLNEEKWTRQRWQRGLGHEEERHAINYRKCENINGRRNTPHKRTDASPDRQHVASGNLVSAHTFN
jgi:hypothetical protein